MDDTRAQIIAILEGIRQDAPDMPLSVAANDDLFALGILDSFGMISYIVKLEEAFGVAISNEELIPQNFWSIEATEDTIRRLQA